MTTAEPDFASNAASDPHVEAGVFERLAPTSLTVLANAEGMRQQTSHDKVHMEHVLLGISRADANVVVPGLGDVGDDASYESIVTGAARALLPQPEAYKVIAVDRMPVLSSHTKAAIDSAGAAADSDRSASIEARHLLASALTVTNWPVKALIERGITTDLMPRVAIRRTKVEPIDDALAKDDELARASTAS